MLITGYGLFISGLQVVLTARTVAVQTRAVIDAALVTLWVAFATLAWAGPHLASRLSGYPLLASLLYLPLSLAIVFMLLQLIMGSQSRSCSVWLLAMCAALTVVSELNFLAVAAGQSELRRVGIGAATLSIVALSAAIRHPSAPELETPISGLQEPLTLVRTLYVSLSLAAIPTSLIVFPRPDPYLATILVAISIATGANLALTARQRERQIRIERQLRLSVAEILRADTPKEILELGGLAIDRVLSNKAYVDTGFYRRDGNNWISAPDSVVAPLGPAADQQALTQAIESETTIRDERASGVPGSHFVTHLAIPLADGRNFADVVAIEASPVLTTIEIEQLEQLTSSVELALVAYELHEADHYRRTDQRFRALVQDSSDVVAIIDAELLTVQMVSPSIQRILGRSDTDTIGTAATALAHEHDREIIEDLLCTAITRPQGSTMDVRLQHVDGHYNWFSLMVRDHTTDAEIGGIVMNLTDIQDRKMAELSLGFSERRYRALVLNSNDVFAILNRDNSINYVSPNVVDLLGFNAADLVATQLSNLMTAPSAARLDEFISDGMGSMHRDLVELEFRTDSGERRMAEVTVSDNDDTTGGDYLLTIRDITERRKLEHSLRDQALYDGLTGLANRDTLHFELQQQLQRLRPDQMLGLVHIDINDFKAVNESVGFEAGDELLVQVATRLRSNLRSADILSRLGGNHFAIAIEGGSRQEILGSANRINQLFEKPFEVADHQHRLSVSIGIDITDDRSVVARELMEQALLAVGAARKETHTTLRVFEPTMRTHATERFELAADLVGAIDRGEMHVVYQPILEMGTRKVRGVEALLRWTHPQRGPVSPGVFIPLAEQSGLVVDMGRWVMGQACEQLKCWHRNIEGAERLGVSVNVSAIQLELADEAKRLCQIVTGSGIDPSRVTVELTESTLIEDADWTRAQLQAMRKLGMKVAVDDFGTGAAGLNHLRDIPFNTIKIDKSYVDALSQSAEAERLVRGVIELAHTLGAETVAEGIAEPAEFDLLHSLRCDLGQGFYLGCPMDPVQLEAWFAMGRTGSAPALIATGTG